MIRQITEEVKIDLTDTTILINDQSRVEIDLSTTNGHSDEIGKTLSVNFIVTDHTLIYL